MRVHRVRCDGCNVEVDTDRIPHRLPNGWWELDGPYSGGEPYTAAHACSVDCLSLVAHRLRVDDSLLPAVMR